MLIKKPDIYVRSFLTAIGISLLTNRVEFTHMLAIRAHKAETLDRQAFTLRLRGLHLYPGRQKSGFGDVSLPPIRTSSGHRLRQC